MVQKQKVALEIDSDKTEEPPSRNGQQRKWRAWHEREIPIQVIGKSTPKGVSIKLDSKIFSSDLSIEYPNSVWQKYRKKNKVKLVDNITYIFTAHLPFLLKGNIRLEYNTGYPQAYSWANHCFMRHLPSYWYLYQRRGTGIMPLLKTMINSNASFSETMDEPPEFPATDAKNIIIPFTFGKDSFLTYRIAKELNLKPTLVFFEDPTDEGYEGIHKIRLFKEFSKIIKDKTYYIRNPLGNLREKGQGWFGWELALTSWAVLSLPFAYHNKAGYVVFSNEKSVNTFFYDDNGFKIATEFEQSDQGTEELSLLTQALSEGEVYTTTFLQGLHDLGILGILKNSYYNNTFKYLMSCWSETEAASTKRWCADCSKCARLYVYLKATGIDPIKEAGYEDNMLTLPYRRFYNVFGQTEASTGWDAFGVNKDEMALAFYLCYLRGSRDPLIRDFSVSSLFEETKNRFPQLVNNYYGLHAENITPPQWKSKINHIFRRNLSEIRQELFSLQRDQQ
jgi:hypothetical protein